MATALKDLYKSGSEPFDQIIVPDGYQPSETEEFMSPLQRAYFLGKLKAVKEGGESLLDRCMIVYGSGISDGNRHNHDELPILVAGKGAGSIKTGRHIRYPKNTPLNNLFLSHLDRIDSSTEGLGDSTGRLPLEN